MSTASNNGTGQEPVLPTDPQAVRGRRASHDAIKREQGPLRGLAAVAVKH